MPAMRPQPCVPPCQGVPQARRQRRDRLGGPRSRRWRAGTPPGRRTGRVARHNGQRLAASGAGQQRDHHVPCDDLPFRPGPRHTRTASKVRHAARQHGSHGRGRRGRMAATLRHRPASTRSDRHTPTDRLDHCEWLAAGRHRDGFSPVLATRLRGPPVCFDAPENPPTTTSMRTNTPNPSSPTVSTPSSTWPAVNTRGSRHQHPVHGGGASYRAAARRRTQAIFTLDPESLQGSRPGPQGLGRW
jgi:hypothetical protein